MDTLNLILQAQEAKIRGLRRQQKIFDTMAVILALLGWILESAEFEQYYNQIAFNSLDSSGSETIYMHDENEVWYLTFLRSIISGTTLVLLYSVLMRYQTEASIKSVNEHSTRFLLFKTIEHPTKPRCFSPQHLKMWRMLPLELLILAFHSLPKANRNFLAQQQKSDIEYSLDTITYVCMNVRVYLAIRLVQHYSKWMNSTAIIFLLMRVSQTQNTTANRRFALKALFKERPFTVIATLVLLLLCITGFALRALERPYMYTSGKDWSYFQNGIWCIFAIITTVGYGDFFPTTYAGRTVGVLACLAGQFLVSLIITGILRIAEFSENQSRAFYKSKKLFAVKHLEELEKNTMKYGFRLLRRMSNKKNERRDKNYTNFFKSLVEAKLLKQEMYYDEILTPIEFLMKQKWEQITEKKFDIIKAMKKIAVMFKRFDKIEESFTFIEGTLSSVHECNSNVLASIKKVADYSSYVEPFDGLRQNVQSLDMLDELKAKYVPLNLSYISSDEVIVVRFAEKNLSAVIEKQRKRRAKRFQLAKQAVDPHFVKMSQAPSIMNMPLYYRRAIYKSDTAKITLAQFIHAAEELERDGRERKKFMSGEAIGRAILSGRKNILDIIMNFVPIRHTKLKEYQIVLNDAKLKQTITMKSDTSAISEPLILNSSEQSFTRTGSTQKKRRLVRHDANSQEENSAFRQIEKQRSQDSHLYTMKTFSQVSRANLYNELENLVNGDPINSSPILNNTQFRPLIDTSKFEGLEDPIEKQIEAGCSHGLAFKHRNDPLSSRGLIYDKTRRPGEPKNIEEPSGGAFESELLGKVEIKTIQNANKNLVVKNPYRATFQQALDEIVDED